MGPPPSVSSVLSVQQLSATSQIAPWSTAWGKDDATSLLAKPLGWSVPFTAPVSVPLGEPPTTSVVATQPSSVAQLTATDKSVKSYPLLRQQEADGLATGSAKDAESQSQGTDIGSVSDSSQEEPALGESQSSVTFRTPSSPSQVRQLPFPSITINPGTPSKSTPASTSVSSSQPATTTSTVAPLQMSKPLFGSLLQPTTSGSSTLQFVASAPVHSGDGRDSPFELGLRDHRRTPSPAAQAGEVIQFKTSMQDANAFLSGDSGAGNETAKGEEAKDGKAAGLAPQPLTGKQFGGQENSGPDNKGQASAGASKTVPASAATTAGLTSTQGLFCDFVKSVLCVFIEYPPYNLRS